MSKNLDELAGDLAYARLAARNLTHTDPETDAYRENVGRLLAAFRALDNGQAFRQIDEYTDYADAADHLADIKARTRFSASGDHIDFSGGTFTAPVVAKSVTVKRSDR